MNIHLQIVYSFLFLHISDMCTHYTICTKLASLAEPKRITAGWSCLRPLNINLFKFYVQRQKLLSKITDQIHQNQM
jgi:hypothetical protein